MKQAAKAAMTAAVSLGVLTTSVLAGSGQAVAQSGVALKNIGMDGYVLDNDRGGSTDSSVLVYERNGGANQTWNITPAGRNPVQIQQNIGGEPLCVAAVPTSGIVEVSMQQCDNGGVTFWIEVKVGDNAYVYRSRTNGGCLTATRENAPVELTECDYSEQYQQWKKDYVV
ncbi:RICIN domain-containing protein [Streptomyces aidingensis]|uniref:Ricin-type beta-trefoil lectin domain-containing protein n=1 Tax=Streptomyces aidingensis TaxID=910347 RepID=A0A1I1M488_9ACTN|nr:ricin-type beta-trefoil lectin domain protein [Streptomyces aidingensis]SFC80174.1 Ricin-type beta-trefoil lectin domain-containing protein [Streptomyces aidingensis]